LRPPTGGEEVNGSRITSEFLWKPAFGVDLPLRRLLRLPPRMVSSLA
jgi:hypothetical protein